MGKGAGALLVAVLGVWALFLLDSPAQRDRSSQQRPDPEPQLALDREQQPVGEMTAEPTWEALPDEPAPEQRAQHPTEPEGQTERNGQPPQAPDPEVAKPTEFPNVDDDTLTEEGNRLNVRAIKMRRTFKAETRDPEWADSEEEALRTFTGGLEVGESTKVEEVQCAASVCKVAVAFEDNYEEEARTVAKGFGRTYLDRFSFEPRGDEDGVRRLWIWTNRYGYGRPNPNPEPEEPTMGP